jgi:glycosyltransferase involved in cell wall biosynthesis
MTTVAIVIPVWNRSATLGRAIESALAQHADEVVVVNDASTDASLAVAQAYPVKVVSHPEKSTNWIEALGPTYESLTTDYVVVMGADDVLFGSLVPAVCEAAADRPGVVWSDYALLREGNPPSVIEVRRFGVAASLSPERFRQRIQPIKGIRYECGVGSAIRRDLLCWLQQEEYWRLGPWSDSIGYTVAALRAGCAYVPEVHGGFVVQQARPSYHQQFLADQTRRMELFNESAKWLHRPAIAPYVNDIEFVV